jgi:hypothetical protein
MIGVENMMVGQEGGVYLIQDISCLNIEVFWVKAETGMLDTGIINPKACFILVILVVHSFKES